MTKLTKRMRFIRDKFDSTKQYSISEALLILKETAVTKFIESVDVAINLGIDVRKSDQNIRGAVILPYGTGRDVRVAVFAQGADAEAAKLAGADLVGMDDLAEKIKNNKINFDVIITSPDTMHIVSRLSKILGPRNLMPNSKSGTITLDIVKAIKNAKSGQIRYRNDKNGIIHTTIGKIDFDSDKLKENLEALLLALKKAKPIQTKGIYIKKISLSTTMSMGIEINQNTISAIAFA